MATRRERRSGTNPAEPNDRPTTEGRRRPARDVGEALDRARHHGRAAAAESLAMLHALIEAAALATTGRGPEASRVFSPVAKLLEGLSDELGGSGGDSAARTLSVVAAAIDDEIARWEARAHEDPEARTVLRAFLGLREVLWEFGVRSDASAGAAPSQRPRTTPAARPRDRGPAARVQRVPVQG